MYDSTNRLQGYPIPPADAAIRMERAEELLKDILEYMKRGIPNEVIIVSIENYLHNSKQL